MGLSKPTNGSALTPTRADAPRDDNAVPACADTDPAADGEGFDRHRLTETRAQKTCGILDACQRHDFESLAALAVSESGLVTDQIRRQAWPILLGCTSDGTAEEASGPVSAWERLPEHRDEDQTSQGLNGRKAELSELITEVLRRHPYLCYFQGFHDICQVLLLVLGRQSAVSAVERLSILRIRDFMLPTLSPALTHLRLLPSIIQAADVTLYHHLSQTQPFFALPATLTLYAHDIQEYGDIARLFDVLLAREASFSIYLFAEIVMHRKAELLEIPPDEPEMLHSVLSKLPKPLDLEHLLSKAIALVDRHPPESLRPWRQIPRSSVLKTARDPAVAARQRLSDGAFFYQTLAVQLRKAEQRQETLNRLWAYRRPAGSIGLAVLIGVLAWWARKHGGDSPVFGLQRYLYPMFRRLQSYWWGVGS
ncbi:MAG: hypothetical protein M1838_006005 [Thelocarpon superellum]|nr:MAG: hypothetical protein M1838_006005 [Thelocarpon superellum]